MQIVRRRVVAPAQKTEPVAPRAPVRKRPRPIVAVPATPQAPRKPAPVEEPQHEDKGYGVDYVAVIARYKGKIRNPLTAIRAKCVECSGGALKEVTNCPVTACALYPFRMGTNPLHKKTRDRMAAEGEHDEEGDDE